MKTVQSSVAFQDAQGNAIAKGVLVLQLSQACSITSGGGQVAPMEVRITLGSDGKIPGATQIWANDELTPSGTAYTAYLKDSSNTQVASFGPWMITGASPIDLSGMVASSSGVSYSDAILQNPVGNQTIATGNLTLTTGQFIETANAVTGSGGLVRATSPTLVTPNIGVATATSVNKVALTQPASAATLTIANNKTATFSNSITIAGVDGKTLTVNNNLGLTGTDGTNHTFPNVTGDTIVELAAAQTLTNKTLTSPTTTNLVDTGSSIQAKRFRASQGNSVVSGDLSVSAGWGSTAALSAVSGSDQGFTFTITANGSGIAANPTITFTFHDGTWTNPPFFVICRGDGNGPATGFWIVNSITATVLTMQFVGTPVSGSGYIVYAVGMGR